MDSQRSWELSGSTGKPTMRTAWLLSRRISTLEVDRLRELDRERYLRSLRLIFPYQKFWLEISLGWSELKMKVTGRNTGRLVCESVATEFEGEQLGMALAMQLRSRHIREVVLSGFSVEPKRAALRTPYMDAIRDGLGGLDRSGVHVWFDERMFRRLGLRNMIWKNDPRTAERASKSDKPQLMLEEQMYRRQRLRQYLAKSRIDAGEGFDHDILEKDGVKEDGAVRETQPKPGD